MLVRFSFLLLLPMPSSKNTLSSIVHVAPPVSPPPQYLYKGMGLFESVQVSMDAVDDGSLDQTDVTVTVKEKNWYLLQSGATTTGTAKGNLDASEFSNLRSYPTTCVCMPPWLCSFLGQAHANLEFRNLRLSPPPMYTIACLIGIVVQNTRDLACMVVEDG